MVRMKTWQQFPLKRFVMLVASFAAGGFWHQSFNALIPRYLAGLAGALSALSVREPLRWFDSRA